MQIVTTLALPLIVTSIMATRHIPAPQDPPSAAVAAIVDQIAAQALADVQNAAEGSMATTPTTTEDTTLGTLLLATDTISPLDTLTFTDPSVYDSLLTIWQQQSSVAAFESFFNDFINIDSAYVPQTNIPDSVYAERLSKILSPIPMVYNATVKRHIVAYTTTRRATMSAVLGRAQYYFPMIEAELDKAGLPLELRMLPVIESSLSPVARSRAGAVGLWQFVLSTGRSYGLEITSFIDQRQDPVLATRAACRFLKDLYDIYGDWTLALAAYNCGPGNVNKALRRAGEGATDFWSIYPYLPSETRNYVPAFIGVTYAYYYHQQHGIVPDASPLPLATDTIHLNRIMHFEQVSSTIKTPIEVIRSLNPQYKLDIVPAVNKTYTLTLPHSDLSNYLVLQDTIMAKDTLYLAQYLKPSKEDPSRQEFSIDSYTYTVKKGDVLGAIARREGVTVKQLMQWNNIKDASKLRIGQKLEIYR